MKLRRRYIEPFSISFLDVICCAFGAIILVLVLSKTGEPRVLEAIRADLQGVVAKLERERHDIRGETRIVNRDLTSVREQLAEVTQRLARLTSDLSRVRGEFASTQGDMDAQRAIAAPK